MKTFFQLSIIFVLMSSVQVFAQSCTGYVTFTQGAYGANAAGNNIGNYLDAHFNAAFPNGLEIGCTNKLKLTSANAVRNFLPQSTTPNSLPSGLLINPTSNSYKNVLAGQLVTLALNIGFDNFDQNFAPASESLQNLVIANGPFANWTVIDLFNEANKKIGDCSASTYSYSDFNNAINNININYDKGLSNLNFLNCPFYLTVNQNNISCNGINDGNITLNVHNGNAPYSYLWSNGDTSKDLANLNAGNYAVTVTDASGQVANVLVNISQPSELIVNATLNNITCNSEHSGSIYLNVTGGVAPYTYNWSNGSNTDALNGLNAGNYSAIISDANGCTTNYTTNLTEPTPILITGEKLDSYACDQFVCDGSADISVQGGVQPYQILWSEGTSNTTSLVNLCPTSQLFVTVTDNNGCNVMYDFYGIACKTCDTLTTYNQNSWGEEPLGNNLGMYLHVNFPKAFPNGLTIGCNNLLTLTNAQSITDWLPKTGMPALLPTGTLTDDINYDNSLASQLVTAKLNTGFDAFDADFNPSKDYLGNRFFTSGLYAGYTLDQVIEEANNAIGGCVPNYNLAELNFALKAANENYEEGTHSNGYLACRFINPIRYSDNTNFSIKLNAVYPNPCSDIVNASVKLSEDSEVKIEIINMLGQVIKTSNEFMNAGTGSVSIDTKSLESQVYILRLNNGHNTCSSMLMVK
ncbi:MAG: T9SS type A sorting domain-containing protein [Bacteroidota bacterium]